MSNACMDKNVLIEVLQEAKKVITELVLDKAYQENINSESKEPVFYSIPVLDKIGDALEMLTNNSESSSIQYGVNINKSRQVYDYLKQNSFNFEGMPEVMAFSNNIILNDEIIGTCNSAGEIFIHDDAVKMMK